MFFFVALALGFLVVGQTVSALAKVGAIEYLGSTMVIVVVRELGPLLAAFLVLARVGTAELETSTMGPSTRSTRQPGGADAPGWSLTDDPPPVGTSGGRETTARVTSCRKSSDRSHVPSSGTRSFPTTRKISGGARPDSAASARSVSTVVTV